MIASHRARTIGGSSVAAAGGDLFLRLDGTNSPNADIPFADQQITGLGGLIPSVSGRSIGSVTNVWDAFIFEITNRENQSGIIFGTGATILNSSGLDLDLRVEGDTDINLLFADAGNDRIGIGIAAPISKLDVNGDITARGDVLPEADGTRTLGSATMTWGTGWVRILRPDVGEALELFDQLGNSALRLTLGVTVLNESGLDKDFRVEGDTDANLLVVNAGMDAVAIGTVADVMSAKFAIESVTSGFLPPRMTTIQRDAIGTPAAGLLIWNTTTTQLEDFDGSVWAAV